MLSNYECMFRKAGITEANSAFNMWSDDRYTDAAPTLADFSTGCRPTKPKTMESNKCNGFLKKAKSKMKES
jgi:hypothetical protein